MKKIVPFLLLTMLVVLSSQTTRHSSTVALPYNGSPMWVQLRDTDNLEISYIFYDRATGRTVVRGNLEQGLRKLNDVYDSTIVPAEEMNYAASRVRQYLNSNGTVKRRDSLTWAIRYYDSLKVKYGYNF